MLRRLTCLLLLFPFLLSFCACSKMNSKEEPVTTQFECDVDVQYGDMNVKGHIKRSTAGTLYLEVNEPATLDGLTMEWNGENISIKLYGLSYNINPDVIPQSALCQGIVDALDAAVETGKSGEATEDGITTTGECSSGEFTILSDPSTGNLLSLTVPSLEMIANFSNFTVTGSSN